MLRRSFVLLLLCGAVACDPQPVTPSSPSTLSKAVPTRFSDEDLEWIFRKSLQRHLSQAMIPARCGFVSSWTEYEVTNFLTETRLLARISPTLTERLILEVLKDPEAPQPSRNYAWYALTFLAPRTSPTLEQFLMERAAEVDVDDRDHPSLAIRNLALRRLDEPVLAILRSQARRGNFEALEVLTEVDDPKTVALLREMAQQQDGTEATATRLLQRIAILQSKDWAAQVARLLAAPENGDYYVSARWALAVARRRTLPNFQAALLKGLTKAREAVRPGPVPYPWDAMEATFDHLLVAYADSGGALTDAEKKYLALFGLHGDFAARLRELFAERTN